MKNKTLKLFRNPYTANRRDLSTSRRFLPSADLVFRRVEFFLRCLVPRHAENSLCARKHVERMRQTIIAPFDVAGRT